MRQLVKACRPRSDDEWDMYWADIKPVKYGSPVSWTAATLYTLAQYQVPDQATYHIVLRVECYTVNYTSGSADFGAFEPPPPGFAFWRILPAGSSGGTYNVTDTGAATHRLLDTDEFLFFPSGVNVFLMGNLSVSPDGDTRTVRTLVYGYNVGAAIANKLGRGEMEIPPV